MPNNIKNSAFSTDNLDISTNSEEKNDSANLEIDLSEDLEDIKIDKEFNLDEIGAEQDDADSDFSLDDELEELETQDESKSETIKESEVDNITDDYLIEDLNLEKLEDISFDDKEIAITSDLDKEENLESVENYKMNMVDDEGLPQEESEEEFGVDIKEDPETIDSFDFDMEFDQAKAEAFIIENELDIKNDSKSKIQDLELEDLNLDESLDEKLPEEIDKGNITVDDKEVDYLKSDFEEELPETTGVDQPINSLEPEELELKNFDELEIIDTTDLKEEPIFEEKEDVPLDETAITDDLDSFKTEEEFDLKLNELDEIKDAELPDDINLDELDDLDLTDTESQKEETIEKPIFEKESSDIEMFLTENTETYEENASGPSLEEKYNNIQDVSMDDLDLNKTSGDENIQKDESFEELNIDAEGQEINFDNISSDISEDIKIEGLEDLQQEDFEVDLSEEEIDSVNLNGAVELDEKLDLSRIENIPTELESEIIQESSADSSIPHEKNAEEEDAIMLDEVELSDIEDKIFPDDESMPKLDEDIENIELSGGDEALSNSIPPLSDADTVSCENISDKEIGSLNEIDLENIPQSTYSEDLVEEETIGLSTDELEKVSEDTELFTPEQEELSTISFDTKDTIDIGSTEDIEIEPLEDMNKSKEFEEIESETIDLDSFDAELKEIEDIGFTQEVPFEDVSKEELKKIVPDTEKEEEFYETLKEEMKQKEEEIKSMSYNLNSLKNNVKEVLSYLDQLLDALPEEKIKEFAESKKFELYKKLFDELKILK